VQCECKRFTSDLPTLDNIMGTSRGLVFCARRAMVQIGRKTMAEILREVEKMTSLRIAVRPISKMMPD
jgi:hypothetical protein